MAPIRPHLEVLQRCNASVVPTTIDLSPTESIRAPIFVIALRGARTPILSSKVHPSTLLHRNAGRNPVSGDSCNSLSPASRIFKALTLGQTARGRNLSFSALSHALGTNWVLERQNDSSKACQIKYNPRDAVSRMSL
ncbi:hypothetical protein PM082_006288 [Marasmius tenuissimus]|nr:hypothetical protein PM082_006288 [Marasmius tenuissimus]